MNDYGQFVSTSQCEHYLVHIMKRWCNADSSYAGLEQAQLYH